MNRSPSGKVVGRELDSSLPVEMEQLLASADGGKRNTIATVADELRSEPEVERVSEEL